MKRVLLFMAFMTGILVTTAQQNQLTNCLSKFEKVPAFTIFTVPDSIAFSNKNLLKNKPLVIMFFSPDCDHCQKETKELLAYKEELKNIQILMVSPSSYAAVKQFYEAYSLSTMPNLKLCNDINYALGSIYQLKTFPSIFVYDQFGKLAKAFIGNVGVPAILDAVK